MRVVKIRRSPLLCFALLAVCVHAPAADPKGFPFSDETLNYTVNWPSGLSLGEVRFSARKAGAAWNFSMNLDAGIPGFQVKDSYLAASTAELCATQFERDTQHGAKRSRERESIDQSSNTVTRTTVGGGGSSTLTAPACVRDALTLLYFARRELGQGKVPTTQQFLFGGLYQMKMDYTGAQKVTVGDQTSDADRVNCTVKGPASDFTFEAFFARDAARTPLVVRVPLSGGRFSMELVR